MEGPFNATVARSLGKLFVMERKPTNMDDIPLLANAREVLERRYLLKDEMGRIVETSGAIFLRVAKGVVEGSRSGKGLLIGGCDQWEKALVTKTAVMVPAV